MCVCVCVCVELQAQVAQLTSDLKEERVSGKRARGELQQLREEHAELASERETLQKVCVCERERERERFLQKVCACKCMCVC